MFCSHSQFPLCHSMALFLTYDPFSSVGGVVGSESYSYSVSVGALPNELREHLRVVSVIVPDVLHIVRAKCTVLGFKAPSVLGSRLKMLADSLRAHLCAATVPSSHSHSRSHFHSHSLTFTRLFTLLLLTLTDFVAALTHTALTRTSTAASDQVISMITINNLFDDRRPVEHHSVVGVSGILNILRVALSKKSRLREPTMSERNISGADLVAPGSLRYMCPLLPLLQRHAQTLRTRTMYNVHVQY